MSSLEALTRLERGIALGDPPDVLLRALDAVRPGAPAEAGPLLDALATAIRRHEDPSSYTACEVLLEAMRKALEGRPFDLVTTLAAAAGFFVGPTRASASPEVAAAPAVAAPAAAPAATAVAAPAASASAPAPVVEPRGAAAPPVAATRPAEAPAPAAATDGDAVPEPSWSGRVNPDDAGLLSEFLVEAAGLLDTGEAAALRMEDSPDDADGLNAIFRAFHTVKGVAACLDIAPVVHLMHDLETLMDRVRKGQVTPDPALADLILVGIDRTRQFFTWITPQTQDRPSDGAWPRTADVAASARHFASGGGAATGPAAAIPLPSAPVATPAVAPPSAAPAPDPAPSASVLGGSLPPLEPVADTAWAADPLPNAVATAPVEPFAPANTAPAAHTSPAAPRAAAAPRPGAGSERVVKLEIEKLDGLVDLVGELLVVQRMVQEEPGLREFASQRLAQNLALLARVGRDLQRVAMSMRMVQLAATFDKMNRIVRDVARASGKQATLEVSGTETELDRTVVDMLHDPLMHMVRNAVDHGIEKPAERERLGKPAVGTVHLRAYHEGGQIVVELTDDGQGLDPAKLIRKARERGVIGANEELTDTEAYNLIFAAGFSTADKVTDISGRGVGMDVVRSNIEKIRGRVEIQSKVGAGSTFRIRLPITLAVIDGLIVAVGDERFILPTGWVREAFRPKPGEVSEVYGSGEVVNVRGDLLPLVRLGDCFGSSTARTRPEEALVVVIDTDGERAGLLVDSLVTKQEVVIKSLGDTMTNVPGISGAAILGDGRVGLIVDLHGLRPRRSRRFAGSEGLAAYN